VSSSQRDGSVVSAQCGCAVWNQAGGSTVRSAVAVGSEMRSRLFAGCVAATDLVGGEMLAGSTTGPRPLVRCRDVRCQTMLLPSGSSPTILLLLVVADKLLLAVSELGVPS